MKIITWNVNGIRARGSQLVELVERERPDVLCLQELKAKREQVPEALCSLAGYWCYWHGASAYSGVGLHLRQDRFREEPAFAHPSFDHETRIVEALAGSLLIASVYVPNGGKDYTAKLRFLQAIEDYAASARNASRSLVLCGDVNVARTDRDVHPKERKPNAIGQRPEERELFERVLARGLVDVGRHLDPENENLFTWWARGPRGRASTGSICGFFWRLVLGAISASSLKICCRRMLGRVDEDRSAARPAGTEA